MGKKIDEQTAKKVTLKPRRVFHKRMILDVTGTSKAAVQKVARAIHATSTDETVGGAGGRTVQITAHNSSEPKQIFLGNI